MTETKREREKKIKNQLKVTSSTLDTFVIRPALFSIEGVGSQIEQLIDKCLINTVEYIDQSIA